MRVHPKLRSYLLAIGLMVGVGACASSILNKVGPSNELPKELSKEIKDKFEVQDAPPSAPAVASAQTAATESKKPKGKKDAPTAVLVSNPATTPATPAFAYPSRRPEKDPLWIGEKLVYDITYFGMSAGDFTLDILPHKSIADRKVYHVKGNAVSSSVFSLFYRVNDSVETFMDFEGLFTHRFHIVLDETKQSRDSLELNDSEKGQTYYWNRWNHKVRGYSETKEFAPIPAFPQDSLSALYYLRTLPLTDGAVYVFPVVSEGKHWNAQVTVLRREMMSTPMGKVQTIVLQPEAQYQGVLKKQGDSFLWLTDDDRRVPVRLEAKVKIGTVVGVLKKFEPGNAP